MLDDEALAAPDLDVMAVDQALGLRDGLAIVPADQRLEADELSVLANRIDPIFRHRSLLQRPQLAGQQPGDIRRAQRIVSLAIKTLELAAAGFAKQESHRLPTGRADRRRSVPGHDIHAGSGVRFDTHCHR